MVSREWHCRRVFLCKHLTVMRDVIYLMENLTYTLCLSSECFIPILTGSAQVAGFLTTFLYVNRLRDEVVEDCSDKLVTVCKIPEEYWKSFGS